MNAPRRYRVNEVARITGISVRALHHYDELGLLVPVARSRAGYRLYAEDDLLRLQQVLIGRELGLSLSEIKQALDDPAFDRRAALQRQLQHLTQRAQHTAEMISAVERAITLLEPERTKDDMDMLKLFDGFDPAKYEAEARETWAKQLPTKSPRGEPAATQRTTGSGSAPNRQLSTLTSPRPCGRASIQPALRAWSWRSATADPSIAGFIPAVTSCTPAWPTCTKAIAASPTTWTNSVSA